MLTLYCHPLNFLVHHKWRQTLMGSTLFVKDITKGWANNIEFCIMSFLLLLRSVFIKLDCGNARCGIPHNNLDYLYQVQNKFLISFFISRQDENLLIFVLIYSSLSKIIQTFWQDTVLVSISSTFYKQILLVQIPKVQKRLTTWLTFFVFLGSASIKAACRKLM